MGKELRESRLLALSDRGRVFTQFLTNKSTHLSRGSAFSREVRRFAHNGFAINVVLFSPEYIG